MFYMQKLFWFDQKCHSIHFVSPPYWRTVENSWLGDAGITGSTIKPGYVQSALAGERLGIILSSYQQPEQFICGVGNNTGNNQDKAAFVYGGGVDFDLTRYVAFRAEYRGLVYKIPDFQIPGLASRCITHTAQPSIGLVWRF